jgi:hypothetical protein
VSSRKQKPVSAEEEALTSQFDAIVQKLTAASKGRQKHINDQHKKSKQFNDQLAKRVEENKSTLQALDTALEKCRLDERELTEKLKSGIIDPPEGIEQEIDAEESRRFLQQLDQQQLGDMQ